MTKPTLSFELLADWVDERLSAEEAQNVEKQLETADQATREAAAWLQAFVKAGKNSRLATPPAEIHDELIRRFKAGQPSLIQRLVASLTFDSSNQFATAGVRAVGTPATQRQLIYSTDLLDVALNIQPRPHDQHFDLAGEIFLNRESELVPFSVQLLKNDSEAGLTVTNDNHEFLFEVVPAGVYSLAISTLSIDVLVVPVEVKL